MKTSRSSGVLALMPGASLKRSSFKAHEPNSTCACPASISMARPACTTTGIAATTRGPYLQPDPLGDPDGPDPYTYVGGDPINRIDPMGLYQIDVHYYMTYFLAVMAGLPEQAALTMALAAQYVDDNPNTWPVDPNNK